MKAKMCIRDRAHHDHQQPAGIAQGPNLREALLDVAIVQQLMLGEDHDMLHFRHHMHINAAVDILTRGGKTFAILNGCLLYTSRCV